MCLEAYIFWTVGFWPRIAASALKNIERAGFMFKQCRKIQVESFASVKKLTEILHLKKQRIQWVEESILIFTNRLLSIF